MTQPPGPDESTGPAQPSEPVPPTGPQTGPQSGPQSGPQTGPQSGYPGVPGYPGQAVPGGYPPAAGAPPQYPAGGYDQSQPYPAQYDPSQPYVIYQATPTGGMFHGLADDDPLVSPDYAGWWRRSMAILKQGWQSLAVLQFIGFLFSLVFSVPQALLLLNVLNELNRATQTIDPVTGEMAEPNFGPVFTLIGVLFVGIFLSTLVGFAVAIACNHVAVSVAAGLRPRIGAALGLAMRRVFPLLGWQILASLIVLVGVCACFLPAIYLSAVFLVLPAVVTFERGSSAISRCFKLFHQDLGASISRIATIAGISIGIAVVAYIINQIIQAVPAGGPNFDPNSKDLFGGIDTAYMIAVVIGAALTDLFARAGAVFTSTLTLAAYADLRGRVEPLTTATLANEVGLAPAYPQQYTGGFAEPVPPPPGQDPYGPNSDWMPPNR